MKIFNLFFTHFIAFAILNGIFGCVVGDGLIRVKGRVYDQIGRPLKGALVTVERNGTKFTTVSDDDGIFAISKIVAPGRHDYEFAVLVDGYRTYHGKVRTIQSNRCDITLFPKEVVGGSSANCFVEKH